MRRLLAVTALATTLALLGTAASSQAGGIQDEDTMAIDPAEGLPGTEISVTGSECATKAILEVDVVLLDTEGMEQDGVTVEPDDGFSGDWSATLTVPADTTDYGEWTVDAVCRIVPFEEVAPEGVGTAGTFLIDYTDRPFTVLEPAGPPPVEPPAALPEEAAPDFTG